MKIRLMIQGLSAFLPQPLEAPETMRILIPDVRNGVVRVAKEVTIHVCKHEPRLIFPQGPHWDLAGEHIEILDGNGNDGGGVSVDQSFWDRMTDMQKIAPGSEMIHPGYLGNPPQRPSNQHVPLAADFTIRNGKFSVENDDMSEPLTFLRRPDDVPGVPARFATFIHVQIEIPGNQATFKSRRYNNPAQERTKILTTDDEDEVLVFLANRCNQPDQPGQPDNDFVIYYDLSHNYDGPKFIPYQAGLAPHPGVEVNGQATFGGGCVSGLFRG